MEGFFVGGSQVEGGCVEIVEQVVGIELQDFFDQCWDEFLGIEQYVYGEQLQCEWILVCVWCQGWCCFEVDFVLFVQVVVGGVEQLVVVQLQCGGFQVDGVQFGVGQVLVDGFEQQCIGVFCGLVLGLGVFQGCVFLCGEWLVIVVVLGKFVECGDQFVLVGFLVGEVDVFLWCLVGVGQVVLQWQGFGELVVQGEGECVYGGLW